MHFSFSRTSRSGVLSGIMLAWIAMAQTPHPLPVGAKTVPEVGLDTYHQILDLVFPYSRKGGPQEPLVVFSLTLRIIPAFGPESQARMTLFQDRTTKVEFAVADQNIYHSSNELLRTTGEGRPDALASKINIKRYVLNLPPARLLAWQQSLFKSVGPTLLAWQDKLTDTYQRRPVNFLFDGDTYDLWYEQGLANVHVSIPEDEPASPLVTWAKAVHSEIAKLAVP
jgi:hypothetical protein